MPSVYACYRFAAKLRRFKPLLDAWREGAKVSYDSESGDKGPRAVNVQAT